MELFDISTFRKYPTKHPFRVMLETGFDENCRPVLKPETVSIINAMQAIRQVLSVLKEYSQEAFNSFVCDKLVAKKGKEEVDLHNLLSALCELSVMYAFIMASDERESFIYEPRLIEDSKKNVEFSIRNCGRLYNVEVKSANMLRQNEVFAEALEEKGMVVEPNARILPLEDWQKIVGDDSQILGSLDNKVADFLESAQEKFPSVTGDTVNLLVICWDGSYRKALTALKSKVNGLLTKHTYKPKLEYDHISHVLVTTTYGFVRDWLEGRLPGLCALDPLNLRFSKNFLIDYNINNPQNIHERLQGILGCAELPVVDENYVSTNCEDALYSFQVDVMPPGDNSTQ